MKILPKCMLVCALATTVCCLLGCQSQELFKLHRTAGFELDASPALEHIAPNTSNPERSASRPPIQPPVVVKIAENLTITTVADPVTEGCNPDTPATEPFTTTKRLAKVVEEKDGPSAIMVPWVDTPEVPYYFRPYQFTDIANHQTFAPSTLMSNPYDNRVFREIQARHRKARSSEQKD